MQHPWKYTSIQVFTQLFSIHTILIQPHVCPHKLKKETSFACPLAPQTLNFSCSCVVSTLVLFAVERKHIIKNHQS